MRQRKISQNLGQDTHVRDHVDNLFQVANNETYGMQIGEIMLPQPEPLFSKNAYTVKLARGGTITGVAYPNAFRVPLSGKVHGLYEGVIPGQMVVIGFENGNKNMPFVVNRYPYQGVGNSITESSYIMPTFKAMISTTDVVLGHFSGSFLSFNSGIFPSIKLPGSVTLNAMTSLDISALTNIDMSAVVSTTIGSNVNTTISSNVLSNLTSKVQSKISSDLGGTVAVNALIQIKNTAQSMLTLINSLLTVIEGLTTTPCVPGAPASINPASIALIKAERAKWALLLQP